MFQKLALRLCLPLRYTHECTFAFACRMFAKDASCGDKKSKCNSKDKPKPSCKRTRKSQDCSKKQAPYPSFSECKRKPAIPKSPSDCDCLKLDK